MPLSSCKTVRAFSAMLDNSSSHVAELKYLKYFKIGVGMSPHRIGKKFQQKTPKFPQKSLFKITDISSFKFDGARPSRFKIEMQ